MPAKRPIISLRASAHKGAERAACLRYREKQRGVGLTFAELLARSPSADRELLASVLRDELRRGRVEYHSTSRRYVLNGGLPEDVKAALRELQL